jgi:hypothetical protein
MNEIQTVSKYIALSEEGLVSKLECPIDQGLLFANLDQNDNIFLYCLSCEHKIYPGISFFDKIGVEVKNVLLRKR